MLDNLSKETQTLLIMAMVGALTAIGKLLSSDEKITWRAAIGRSITTGILAMSACAVLLWFPNIPTIALIGVSAVFASLGTSALEAVMYKVIGAKPDA